MQASPCPLSSLADCPALPSLEGAETALRLLTVACLPLRFRWAVDNHFSLGHRLQQQSESQGVVSKPLPKCGLFQAQSASLVVVVCFCLLLGPCIPTPLSPQNRCMPASAAQGPQTLALLLYGASPSIDLSNMAMRFINPFDLTPESPQCSTTHTYMLSCSIMSLVFCCPAAKEAGAEVIDITTARRQQLLGMLQAAQEPADTTSTSASQQYRYTRSGSVTSLAQGQQSPSLSELSVSDPGMKEPESWLLSVQQVGLHLTLNPNP